MSKKESQIESNFWKIFFTLTEDTDYNSPVQQTAFVTTIKNVGHRLGFLDQEELLGFLDQEELQGLKAKEIQKI